MKERIIVWIVLLLIAIGYIGISSTIKSKKTENEKAKQTKILVYNDVASDSVVKETIERDSKLSKKIDCAVVSMPCLNIFDKQSAAYKSKVLGKGLKVAIEASNDSLWYKYIGEDGFFVGVKDYQGSGDGEQVYKAAGFDAKNIAKTIMKKLGK